MSALNPLHTVKPDRRGVIGLHNSISVHDEIEKIDEMMELSRYSLAEQ